MMRAQLICGLFILLTSFACKDSNPMIIVEPPTPTLTGTHSYLALGDSYTIGESVPENDRWTYQLADLLRRADVHIGNPTTIARSGWTTAELQVAIQTSNVNGIYDLVTLLIGVNNQYRGQSLELYQQEFRELLLTAVQFANNNPKKVMVLSVPDWGVTPFALGRDQQQIAQEIDAFNAAAKAECTAAGVAFVDITPISRQAAQDPTYIAPDNLHFTGKMYAEWAKSALPVAKGIFEK